MAVVGGSSSGRSSKSCGGRNRSCGDSSSSSNYGHSNRKSSIFRSGSVVV